MELFSFVDVAGASDESPALVAADPTADTASTTESVEIAPLSLENITRADGYTTAIVGLAIVFFALVVVTIFVTILPRLLASLANYLPEEAAVPEAVPAVAPSDDGGVIAAIGYLMHARGRGGPDG